MPNTAIFKDWLFVQVPKDATGFVIGKWAGNECLDYQLDGLTGIDLPPGSWQIIGKGDAIDWEGIIAPAEITDPRGHQVTAKESGYSVIRSLGMEPGTTLVLKKNEV